MKILISGGTGFLGKATALRLSMLGHSVSILGRNTIVGKALAEKGLKFFQCDLSEAEKLKEACKNQEIVVHCAALASPWGAYEVFHRANVLGTENIVKACLSQNVRRRGELGYAPAVSLEQGLELFARWWRSTHG